MKKSVYILSVFMVILLFLTSCEFNKPFLQKDISNLLKELKDNYEFITQTKKYKSQSGIKIEIEFDSSTEIEFDESIYQDIQIFFSDEEVQERIIEDYGSIEYGYPSISVIFLDKKGEQSHFVKSKPMSSSQTGVGKYSEWYEPHYFNTIENE